MKKYILIIDQGTTSTRSLIYSPLENTIIDSEQIEFQQYFPHNAWVEHDLSEILNTVIQTSRRVIAKNNCLKDIAGIAITNQRETTAIWDNDSNPIYNAIVWQDRRTASRCEELRKEGLEPMVREKTGLLLDPYFCASKIEWIINNIDGAKAKAKQGLLKFGTIDGFLLWNLTGGKSHSIDTTNASRTGIFNIYTKTWDEELLKIYDIDPQILPSVMPSNSHFGYTSKELFGKELPILSMVGDQQSSLFGHLGFQRGDVKATYGTGAFLLVNTGEKVVHSHANLLTTIGIDIIIDNNPITHYALEGSIYIAGALFKWLKDNLGLITTYEELNNIDLNPNEQDDDIILIPALTGLGAPFWNANARGAILGLTRNTNKKMIIKAALQSIALQTNDLLKSIHKDDIEISSLKIDGGVSQNNSLSQYMSDILQLPIILSHTTETTAVGAALIASLSCGIFTDLQHLEKSISKYNKASHIFSPTNTFQSELENLIQRWEKSVELVNW